MRERILYGFWAKVWERPTVQRVEADEDRLDDLISSINDAAKQTSAFLLTYLITLTYIAVTSAAASDFDLLVDSHLTLPILGVGVVLRHFFMTAPILVLFLHLSLLLHEYFLAQRIHRLPLDPLCNGAEVDRFYLLPSLAMRFGRLSRPIAFLLRSVFFSVTALLPIVVLLLLQARFLPYHHPGITLLHQVAVTLDLLLLWFFVWIRPRSERSIQRKAQLLRLIEYLACLLVSGALFAASWQAFVVPQVCQPSLVDKVVHRNLRLSHQKLVAEVGPHSGLRLIYRDLRCADFESAEISFSDFRGTDLSGANLARSSLRGSNFSPLPSGELSYVLRRFSGRPEDGGLKLITRLDGAVLSRADLRQSSLRSASLKGAILDGSDLRGADLSAATLDEADLSEVDGFAVDLTAASLTGSVLRGARMQAGRLTRARASFADFSRADLEGADLSLSEGAGAEFLNASLQGAFGLPLQFLDLGGAKLARARFCGSGRGAQFVDFRAASLEEVAGADPEKLRSDLGGAVDGAVAALSDAKGRATCIIRPQERPRIGTLLGPVPLAEPPPAAQPGLGPTQTAYYDGYAEKMVQRACQELNGDSAFLRALVRRFRLKLLADREDELANRVVSQLEQQIAGGNCVAAKKSSWFDRGDLDLRPD